MTILRQPVSIKYYKDVTRRRLILRQTPWSHRGYMEIFMMGREKRHVWSAIKSSAVIHKSSQNGRERPRRGVFVCRGIMERRSKNGPLLDLHSARNGAGPSGRLQFSYALCRRVLSYARKTRARARTTRCVQRQRSTIQPRTSECWWCREERMFEYVYLT